MIVVENATKCIKGTDVLRNINMTIPRGTTVGLSGVNGSGKTMLLRALAGLIKLTSGTISLEGRTLGCDIAFPPSVGVLIENPAFLDTRTGFDNLSMLASIGTHTSSKGRDSKKHTAKLATTALEVVGLNPQDRRKFRKYSLGMKQRLGLAAAILENPDLILLDEPTNALDEKGVALFKQLTTAQQQRGATIVIACHDAALLNELSDEVYFLYDGGVVDHTICEERV